MGLFLFFGFSGSITFLNMLQNLLQNKGKIVLGLLLIFLFALIREFEKQLFYDPFLSFLKVIMLILLCQSTIPFVCF